MTREEEERKLLIETNNKSYTDLCNSVDGNLNVCEMAIERTLKTGDEYTVLNFANFLSRNTINPILLKDIVSSLKSTKFSILGRIQVYKTENNMGILIYWGPTCRKYSNLKEL